MQLGVVLPHHEIGSDPGALRAFAQGAEALGFDHLLLYDHVLGADPARPEGWNGPYDKDVRFREPFTTMAFLAACTDRLELATGVLVLPQRQTALVAKQAAEVALLSEGRLRLGIGTGWNTIEYEALGVDFDARGQRQAEQVELLRALWTQDSVDYTGRYHRVNKASINPRPQAALPVWFGGGVDAVLQRAARIGDGWIPIGRPDAKSRASIERLHGYLRDAGRDPSSFGIQAQAQIRGGGPERWQAHADAWRELGCTHLAIASQNAGLESIDAHLRAMAAWREAATRGQSDP